LLSIHCNSVEHCCINWKTFKYSRVIHSGLLVIEVLICWEEASDHGRLYSQTSVCFKTFVFKPSVAFCSSLFVSKPAMSTWSIGCWTENLSFFSKCDLSKLWSNRIVTQHLFNNPGLPGCSNTILNHELCWIDLVVSRIKRSERSNIIVCEVT